MSETFRTSRQPSARPRRAFGIALIVLAAAAIGFFAFAGFITERMWFESVGQTIVFDTILRTQIFLFIIGGVVAAGLTVLNLWLAFRSRPPFIQSADMPGLERVQEVLSFIRKFGFILIPALVGLLTAVNFSGSWQLWMQFRNAQPFGDVDETFGIDISYFVFELPFWRNLQSSLSSLLLLLILISLVVHYLIGSIRPAQTTSTNRIGLFISDGARMHIAILGGTYLLLQAWSLWLDRYELALKSDVLMTGLKYVDANVNLPALNVLMPIALVCAALFFVNIVRTNWTLPILGTGLFVIATVLLGSAWPSFVQQVQVRPDEQAKESPYIAFNIEATRKAYGLSDVDYQSYVAQETADPEILAGDQASLRNIRLLDPTIVSSTVEQLQQLKGFYSFAPNLDVSRYEIDGETRGAVLAVREVNLAGIPETQRNWVTNHLIYTHGIGLAAAFDNTSTADGQPFFIESDVPPNGLLDIDEPRIYFGENSPEYSIVGGSGKIELDYPDDTSPTGQQNTTYKGKGGVAVGGLFNKMLFAARYGEANILLSEQVTEDSRILYKRNPADRIQAVAPWLTLDGDPYPAVIDGRVVWILDGYTTSANYPYSRETVIASAVTDSLGVRTVTSTLNYIRNSVKATVDAYDGTVTLYLWDETDPIAKAWKSAFPELFKDKSEMSEGLMSQVRYPEDLFKIQRDILRKYHISDPGAFFTGENFWIIPDDPTLGTSGLPQPPYYLNLKMPGDDKAVFSLTSTFAPQRRPSLAGFLAVNSDANSNYGKITLLQLPSQTTIPGPVQAQNLFESDADISSELSLLRRGGSDVVLGNLLSLPIGGGILYVQPVYVESVGVGGFPLLRKVQVGFGQKVVLANSLAEGLRQVLGEQSPNPDPDPGPIPEPDGTIQEQLDAALARAAAAYEEGQAALRNNDFAAYGKAQEKLAKALKEAQRLANQLGIGA
ncbi:MAG: hypothetical protein RIS09_990 [Actinomycetota bacterium]